jgi:PAT family beta-lactamase induction signal transducer AmpG
MLGLLSVSSGVPLGWIYFTYQAFLIGLGVPKATMALLSGVSVAWTVKFLWSPLVDRYALRWPGRRRSWVIAMQLALAGAFVAWAGFAWRTQQAGSLETTGLLVAATLGFAVAFLSATQDIALDAYAVELLHPEEREPASGLRIAWYRVGMLIASGVMVSLSEWVPWPILFLSLGAIFVAFVFVTLASPEPERPPAPPRSLASAVVEPFSHFFQRPDAIGLALFLVFYKFGDNVGGTMVVYFLKDMCFRNAEIGAALKTIGFLATVTGALAGAALMLRLGLARSLWIFGAFQAGANLLYSIAAMSRHAPLDLQQCAALPAISLGTRLWAYGSIAGEQFAQAMGTAAQGALLLRVCDKRYSATQFALLTSLFALGRWGAGLPSGWLAERLGYPIFFAACATVFALPGFVFLQRIAPFWSREVRTAEATPEPGASA